MDIFNGIGSVIAIIIAGIAGLLILFYIYILVSGALIKLTDTEKPDKSFAIFSLIITIIVIVILYRACWSHPY